MTMTKDKDEWGNIELPGLSDEELYSKNWNMVRDSENLVCSDEWKENHRIGISKRSESESWKIKTSLGNKKKAQEENNRINYLKGIEQRNQSEHFIKIVKDNGLKRKKPIVVPWGTFDSRKSAVQEGIKLSIINPLGKIQKGLLKYPDQYYYIED